MFAPPIWPNEVLKAVEYAKIQNPEDTYGDSAFDFNIGRPREVKGVVYHNANITILTDKGRKSVPLKLAFLNLPNRSKLCSVEERKKLPGKASQVVGHNLSFTASDTFDRIVSERTQKVIEEDGKKSIHIITTKRVIVEQYGAAKVAISEAFNRVVNKGLKDGSINLSKTNNNDKIAQMVVKTLGVDDKKRDLHPDDYILRSKLDFEKMEGTNVILPNAGLKKGIFITDVDKPITDKNSKTRFQPAKAIVDDHEMEITYNNVGTFLTQGSICSGIDNMSSWNRSNFGISLGSSIYGELMVKHVDASAGGMGNLLSDDDMSNIGNVNKPEEHSDLEAVESAMEAALDAGLQEEFENLCKDKEKEDA